MFVFRIDDLLDRLNKSAAEAAAELAIPERVFSELRAGDWISVKQEHINTLWRVAKGVRVSPLVRWRLHPLWKTVANAPFLVFHAANSTQDAELAVHLRKAAEALGAPGARTIEGKTSPTEIAEYLAHNNCVFVGSSGLSRASDLGLLTICRAEAAAPEHARSTLPVLFAFLKEEWPLEEQDKISAIGVDQAGECGLRVGASLKHLLQVTHHASRGEFRAARGTGRDGGALVARRIRDEGREITAMVLAGHSALATQQLGYALLSETIPIRNSHLADDAIVVRLLRFAFEKRTRTGRKVIRQHREWFTTASALSGWSTDGLPTKLDGRFYRRRRDPDE